MGIFDFLSPSSGKHLSKEKLDALLRQISALSPEEREYVKAVFGRYLSEGISKEEAARAIRDLRINASDNLDAGEVEKIKLKILSFFV